VPADVVAGFDYQLVNATDMWEMAFPGRQPYLRPEGEGSRPPHGGGTGGAGKEDPDFKDAAPRAPAPLSGEDMAAVAGDPKVARLLKELGLLTADGGAAGPAGEPPRQGEEPALSMALVRPVMEVVQEVSQPLMKEPQEGTPAAGISPAEKGIEEADSEKLEYVAKQILQRVNRKIETEQDRRGY